MEAIVLGKVGWRFAITTSGAQCVMTHGVPVMPEWSVDSWDTPLQVSEVIYEEYTGSYIISVSLISTCMYISFCIAYRLIIFYLAVGATAYASARFGQGVGPIVMDDVLCTTMERRLIDCPFILNHNCDHHEDAGVRCFSSTNGIYY